MDILKAAVVVALLAVSACSEEPPARPASPAPTASDGSVISGCAMRVRDELEDGLAPRAVRVGPISFVTFGIHAPRGSRPGALSNFKVMVEVRPDARVTVSLPTSAAALLFDRSNYRDDNAYVLADGARSVQFETCSGKPATFVGAVVTTGPTEIPLDVAVEGGPVQRIQLAVRA